MHSITYLKLQWYFMKRFRDLNIIKHIYSRPKIKFICWGKKEYMYFFNFHLIIDNI